MHDVVIKDPLIPTTCLMSRHGECVKKLRELVMCCVVTLSINYIVLEDDYDPTFKTLGLVLGGELLK